MQMLMCGAVAFLVPTVLNGQVLMGAYAKWCQSGALMLALLVPERQYRGPELCLSFQLWDFPAMPVPEKEFFASTAPSQEIEAFKTVDLTEDLSLLGAGSL